MSIIEVQDLGVVDDTINMIKKNLTKLKEKMITGIIMIASGVLFLLTILIIASK